MDIYIVLDGTRVVGASARLQGAELIRTDYAKRVADANYDGELDEVRRAYDRARIVNTELRDAE